MSLLSGSGCCGEHGGKLRMTVTKQIETWCGGAWKYNRMAGIWEQLGSTRDGDTRHRGRYVVREPKGLVVYDRANPDAPGLGLLSIAASDAR